MTGIGGFLQEFLYGYSGLRFTTTSVTLDPALNAQLAGLVLHNLRWHGRTFTVRITGATTRVTLQQVGLCRSRSGAPCTGSARAMPLSTPTRRPDTSPDDRPRPLRLGHRPPRQPGAIPLAAVDGSPATGWQPASVPATLTAPLVRHGAATSAAAIT